MPPYRSQMTFLKVYNNDWITLTGIENTKSVFFFPFYWQPLHWFLTSASGISFCVVLETIHHTVRKVIGNSEGEGKGVLKAIDSFWKESVKVNWNFQSPVGKGVGENLLEKHIDFLEYIWFWLLCWVWR